jgi:hypothetical protein
MQAKHGYGREIHVERRCGDGIRVPSKEALKCLPRGRNIEAGMGLQRAKSNTCIQAVFHATLMRGFNRSPVYIVDTALVTS